MKGDIIKALSSEIPFGHIKRSTQEDTAQSKAQIEVAALQWVDLSEESHGVALYNDCKYGFRIKGNVIDMALLRSVPHPGAALIDKADRADSKDAIYTDLGRHEFRYALRPHRGPVDTALLTAEARTFNTPLAVSQCKEARELSSGRAKKGTWIAIDSPAIELAAWKQAEAGKGWIFRLVNLTDSLIKTKVFNFLESKVELYEIDLCENRFSQGRMTNKDSEVLFQPFEIKTFLCQENSAVP